MMLSPAAFREALLIDSAAGPVRLADAIAANPWQSQDFAAIDPGWQQAAGIPVPPGSTIYQRAWLERPRGHSKTTDTATMICWALFAAPRRRSGVMAAASKDQAGLLRTAVEQIVRMNPWLSTDGNGEPLLEVQQYTIINRQTGSKCDVLSSDATTSWGLLVDFIAVDELTVWPNDELWGSLLSAIAKKAHGYLQVISNAGWDGSWVEKVYKKIQALPSWYFHSLQGVQATWISSTWLAEQEALLHRLIFDRVWRNLWVAAEDSALGNDVIDAAFRGIAKMLRAEQGWGYGAGLDLSVNRDLSAFAIVARNRDGHYRLANWWEWRAPEGQKINQGAIRQTIREAKWAYRLKKILSDPYQAEASAEILRTDGVNIITRPQVGAQLHEQASLLIQAFSDGNISLPSDESLKQQLQQVRVRSTGNSLRLVSPRTKKWGHADLLTAISLAIVAARDSEPLSSGPIVWEGHFDREPMLRNLFR
jgi:phage terminase large subunit-like protein